MFVEWFDVTVERGRKKYRSISNDSKIVTRLAATVVPVGVFTAAQSGPVKGPFIRGLVKAP